MLVPEVDSQRRDCRRRRPLNGKRKGRRALRRRPSLATAGSGGPVPLHFHA